MLMVAFNKTSCCFSILFIYFINTKHITDVYADSKHN